MLRAPHTTVLVDLDGTLIDTEAIYIHTLETFGSLVEGAGFHPLTARRLALAIDHHKALSGEGPHRMRFPTSLVDAYREMCRQWRRAPAPAMVRAIEALGATIYSTTAALMPGAEACIHGLIDLGYQPIIYTLGDKAIQDKRITETGLGSAFADRWILRHKDAVVLAGLLQSLRGRGGLPVKWMIGNSPRTDILPALTCGLRAVWYGQPGYDYDHAPLPEGAPYLRSHHLAAIPALMRDEEEKAA